MTPINFQPCHNTYHIFLTISFDQTSRFANQPIPSTRYLAVCQSQSPNIETDPHHFQFRQHLPRAYCQRNPQQTSLKSRKLPRKIISKLPSLLHAQLFFYISFGFFFDFKRIRREPSFIKIHPANKLMPSSVFIRILLSANHTSTFNSRSAIGRALATSSLWTHTYMRESSPPRPKRLNAC